MSARETINGVLVYLFNEIWELEEQAIITEEFKDITNNDMHVIEAVGLEGNNMSAIAKKLNITMGSLSTAMNSLVKKHYAERNRSERDRRVVNIRLTAKGRKAYASHREFHDRMTDAVLAHLNEEQVKVLAQALENLTDFFKNYGKES
ncbi:MAG TPA: winged helix DNA-binding protein [Candidatus Scatomonas pullistercoris]|uniref:Winged helix DNA-binding protein n=1 Tax=Candidatus Scatomonas pullistercoris TaxID=2840920 RepID=A0A9D1T9J1_9FIRM|nr:winged helix DNA-binding protein [Candidatus Scatomonas pullistercoris]